MTIAAPSNARAHADCSALPRSSAGFASVHAAISPDRDVWEPGRNGKIGEGKI